MPIGKIIFTSVAAATLMVLACSSRGAANGDATENQPIQSARRNAIAANEGFRRCIRLVSAWLEYADPETGLIPRNLDWQAHAEPYKKRGRDVWDPKDSAADNYPFMVLAASLLDRPMFEGRMLDMLRTETRLTSRLDRLPDTYSFSKRGFLRDETNLAAVLFGSSEYVKDGLLPLTEWLGPSPWSERMIGILDDMWKHAPIDTPFGRIVSDDAEVNGEMLQTLSRVYWMTGEAKYLEWAVRLGDYHLLGGRHPTRDASYLRLRDHGCEIVSGLCELYATVHFAMPEKKAAYQEPLHAALDRILEVGRNEHGLFFNAVDPQKGEPLDRDAADTWGYTLNGLYTVYLIDGTETYRQAVLKALASLNEHYRGYDWEAGSADGYADAVEGALYLHRHEPTAAAAEWTESQIRVLWSKQRDDGLIEGWHCDGNFARTTLLYCLWKTCGVRIRPWREDVVFGAEPEGDGLWLSLRAARDWRGRIAFDAPRHRTIMHLPIDWPRINHFPEWFVVEAGARYVLSDPVSGKKRRVTGDRLCEGISLSLVAGQERQLHLRPIAAGRAGSRSGSGDPYP